MPTLIILKAFFLRLTHISLVLFMLLYAYHFITQPKSITLLPIMFMVSCLLFVIFALCHIFGILLGIDKTTRDYDVRRSSKPDTVNGGSREYK